MNIRDKENKKKKVAFITNSLAGGGTERVISRLVPYLCEKYDFTLFLLDSSVIEYEVNCKIVNLGKREPHNRLIYLWYLIKCGRKFSKYIKRHEIECVVSFLIIPDIINILFNTTSKKIINIRNDLQRELSKGFFSKIKYYFARSIYNKSDAAIVPSYKLKEQLECRFNYKKDIFVIYNPFDLKEIEKKSGQDISASEAELFDRKNVLVSMGRLNEQKGYQYLLDVISNLKSQIDILLVIIGEGSFRKRLEDKIASLELSDNVFLLGRKDNPFSYIKLAKVFVMSSLNEGFPNALVEAMACGIPVVSTDCQTGPREILYEKPDICVTATNIEYADYGILVPDINNFELGYDDWVEYMSNGLQSLLNNIEQRERYSSLAKNRSAQFTIEKSVQGYSDAIESCLD